MATSSSRQAARKFVEYWTFQRGSEKGEDQQFWNSLLRDVLGVADVERHIQYQVPVPVACSTNHEPRNTKPSSSMRGFPKPAC